MEPHVSPDLPSHPQRCATAGRPIRARRVGDRLRGDRWLVAAIVVSAGVFGGTTAVRALTGEIGDAATVATPAERILTSGTGLLFPIDPSPRCLVFNNFGAFSKTYGGGGHQGVDIGADLGQEVYAVEDGVLERRTVDEPGSAAGNGWVMAGDSGTQFRYYHLAAFAEGLEDGDRVSEGDVIGYVGDTGNASPGGWHLHFEVRPAPDHQPVDPVPLLDTPRLCTVYPKQR
jgi:murein DD-endopeptidase MepM/ murein hydrolase activator NlpD